MSNKWKPTWKGEEGQNNGVKNMFRQIDIDHMKGVNYPKIREKTDTIYELDNYDDVKNNAIIIYGMVKNQRMPPADYGKPWPDEMLLNFKAWMDAGFPLG
jgi:hypothetical protein